MQRTIFNFILAVEGVLTNILRSVLTALGIVFGVAAVIAMLAIGTGAKQALLDQMKLIGTNNIVINSVAPIWFKGLRTVISRLNCSFPLCQPETTQINRIAATAARHHTTRS